VRLVPSDAHPGLVDAIQVTLPGASWQRCRTHAMHNLMIEAFGAVGWPPGGARPEATPC
jgi:hypothetical protein